MLLKVYTDGGFSYKDSVGSWAFVCLNSDMTMKIERSGIVNHHKQTSQVAEIMAIYNSMKFIRDELCSGNLSKLEKMCTIIYSDSQYCVNTINKWMYGWASKGWNVDKENLDLWRPICELKSQFESINAVWVKGHAGIEFNERADQLNQIALKEHLGGSR